MSDQNHQRRRSRRRSSRIPEYPQPFYSPQMNYAVPVYFSPPPMQYQPYAVFYYPTAPYSPHAQPMSPNPYNYSPQVLRNDVTDNELEDIQNNIASPSVAGFSSMAPSVFSAYSSQGNKTDSFVATMDDQMNSSFEVSEIYRKVFELIENGVSCEKIVSVLNEFK